MKNLDEMRALAAAQDSGHRWREGRCPCTACSLARAVLELLPVVEAAMAQGDARDGLCLGNGQFASLSSMHGKRWLNSCVATEHAVAAFRAANREGETKAT